MNVFPLTSGIPGLLLTRPIQTDLLWMLAGLFALLGGVYLLLTFWMRNRISARREAIRLKKRDLAPMISNFLFYQHDCENEDRDTYIAMKIEIRELLKVPMNREVLTEVLMDLRMDVSGEARDRLFQLFQDLDLHLDSFRKLESWRWERISKGILELTDMQVEKAYPFIRKFINDRRSVIRKQAQLATVMLREEGLAYFLDTAHYSISEWQQLKLLEILMQREDYNPPRFRVWLTSENRDVVLFSLRLIRHYRQNDAETALVKLLGHQNQRIKGAALECIREFRFGSALGPIIALFPRVNEELKLLILDTIGLIGSESELGFLEDRASRSGNFIIRSKARSVMNLLKPDSALPDAHVEYAAQEDVNEEFAEKEPPPYPDLELQSEEPYASDKPKARESRLWEPGCGEAVESSKAAKARDAETETTAEIRKEYGFDSDEWAEHEAIFEVCFLEELDDILSELGTTEEPRDILPLDFLPIITEVVPEPDPAEENPEAPEVEADCGAPGTHREKLAGASETAPIVDLRAGLKEDFLPWIESGAAISEAGPDTPPTGLPGQIPGGIPDQPNHLWEPAFELDEMPQPAVLPAGEPYFKQVPDFRDTAQQRFSIFRELFRDLDTASKLILLEQLVEVGEEKEWEFLHELLEDPLIADKVSQAIESLGRKLGLPHPAPQPQPEKTQEEETSLDALGFELDFARRPNPYNSLAEDHAEPAARQTGSRWLRWAVKHKKHSHG